MRRLNLALIICLLVPLSASAQLIHTYAGGGPGSGIPATSANLQQPIRVVVDSSGNYYFAAFAQHRVFKVDGTGTLTLVAGTGLPGFSGDAGPATSASLYYPHGVAVDGAGNVFIADQYNHRIRKVDATTHNISTVAGNGGYGYNGDGIVATSASLYYPIAVAVDTSGNIYIADQYNQRIRKVDGTGTISTVAGTGAVGYGGDGFAATAATFDYPTDVALDASGNLYIPDFYNHRVRKVDATTHNISTVAGTGAAGYNGDGFAATSATLYYPTGVGLDGNGNLYIVDYYNQRIRKVNTSGIISTVAGNGGAGYNGSGILATSAYLYYPWGVAVDSAGQIYIADTSNNRVRKVDTAGKIFDVAGDGSATFGGDGGLATGASLYYPLGLAEDASGNLYISDTNNHRVRKVDTSGNISTIAGTGSAGYNGDGIAATSATLYYPTGLTFDGSGNLYIADFSNQRIRKVDATTHNISTVAGNGAVGYNGDGFAATSAGLYNPENVALDASGNLYITDVYNHRIRKVDATTHNISTIAGTGALCWSTCGDGGPATSAGLYYPQGVAADAIGNIYISDSGNNRIRKVDVNTHTISTVAGVAGTYGFSGDGGLATSAVMSNTYGIALDGAGNLYIADLDNQRIRKVDAVTHIVSTVAGNGVFGFSGDGGPATSAMLAYPQGVLVDSGGNIFIADRHNHRIRKVDGGPILALSSASLDFGHIQYGTTSSAQTITVKNTGGGSLNISTVSTSGDFLETGNCAGSSLSMNGTCTAYVSFLPTATGARIGTLTINDNAPGNPHTVSLTGTGDAASQTITFGLLGSKTYGDADFSVTATASSGLAVSFAAAGNCTLAGSTVHITAAGSCTVTASQAGNTNYLAATNVQQSFNISKVSASVIPNAASKIYGTADPALTGNLSGFLAGDNVIATYSRTAGETVAGSSYSISATLSPAGVLCNYNITYNTANFTITKANASVTPTAASKTYGTADPAFPGTLSGFLVADNVTASQSRIAGETVAGSPYTISATLSPAGVLGNYNITYNTASFTINKANASVTPAAASKTYGTADPAFTGTLSGFLAADNVTAAYSRTAGETVAGSPYTIGATLSPAGVLANYNITSNTASFTINKASASVTPNPASKTYGSTDPSFAGTLSGFLVGDSVTATYSRTAGETVTGGPYTISAVLSPAAALSNYNITSNTANFTITVAPLTVTAANSSRLYGAANPAFTGALTGFQNGDNITATYSTAATSASPAGNYPIVPTLVDPTNRLGNYAVTSNNGTLTISKAPLTVTANNFSKLLNAPLPSYTVSYSGFVLGENSSVLGGTLTFSTSPPAAATSPVGSYSIIPGGLTSSNYVITFAPGTLSILYAPAGGVCDGDLEHTILQPVNADGTSVWKQGRTIPAQFRVCDANGVSIGTPGVVQTFYLAQIISGTITNVDETVSSTNPDTAFRWDPTGQQWIFNISTSSLTANQTYVYTIALNDGTAINFRYGLR